MLSDGFKIYQPEQSRRRHNIIGAGLLTQTAVILDLIQRARRRAVTHLLLEQFAWGIAAGLAAFLALLLFGTQVLNWYWPLLLLVLTASIGWWRSRRRIPAPYRVAQGIDATLGLGDLVSTAYHYDEGNPVRTPDPHFLAVLRSQAESAAAAADPRAAVPWRWPRSAWAAGGALCLASVLFTVRYGVLRTFDLRPPLATVSFDTLTGAPKPTPRMPEQIAQKLPDPFGLNVQDPEGTRVNEKETAVQESLRSSDSNDPNQVGKQGSGQDPKQAEQQDQDSEDGSDEGETASPGKNQTPPGSNDGRKKGDQASQKQGPAPKDNSLMDKMRDALANLMDKLNMEPKGGDSEKMASSKSGQKQQQKGEKGPPQPGKQNQPGDPNDAQPSDQPADADSAQQAQSNQSGNSQDPPSKNEKSGVGKQDGRKDTELAEQREAMGKLSELLGKRSLNVQGEVMVEVTNSKNQQLKTPYVNRTAQHMEAGSDLNRDEVPLHHQDYVQRYYEQVRKPAAAPPGAPKQ